MALFELDAFKPPQLLGFVRSVFKNLEPEYKGTDWLPNETTEDLTFEYILGSFRRPVMATVLSFDAEAPLAARPGVEKVYGELPPIKRKARIGEKEITRFLQPRSGSSDVDNALEQVYDDTARLVESITSRLEWLRIRGLSQKTLEYNEDGVRFEFDFGYRKDLQWDLVADEDGNGDSINCGGPWDNPETATYVQDLIKMTRYMQDEYGFVPDELIVSGKMNAYLQQSDEIKNLVLGSAPKRLLTSDEVGNVFQSYGLPDITTVDDTVSSEMEDGSTKAVRTLPRNKAVLKQNGAVGSTLLGPTAESRVLYGSELSGMAPGVWGETYGTTEPPAEYTKVAAVGFPSIPYADRIMQLKLSEGDGGSGEG